MKITKFLLVLILLSIIPSGCAPRATYVVDLAYTPELKEKAPARAQDIKVAVIPFEDGRADKRIIGTRTRIFGKVDEFEARPAPITAAVTQAVVSALKTRGFQTEILPMGTDPEGIKQSPPHIVLSGRIEEFRADARSKPGFTDIKTLVRLRIKINKVDEQRSFAINVQSQSEPRVVLFNPSIMQNAINETLTDAINRLLENRWRNR